MIYYPESNAYLVYSHGENFRYTFDANGKAVHMEYGEEAADAFLKELYPAPKTEIKLAPIEEFNEILKTTFNVSADTLYALPREVKVVDASSLMTLGFRANQENASYWYDQTEPPQFSVEVHNPEWGTWEEGGDVRFFMPLSDEYRIVIRYFVQERKFLVKGDDNFGGGASFEYDVDRKEFADGWHSDPNGTIEAYFTAAFNDSSIQDVHMHSIELMEQGIKRAFGLTIEELFALPVGN